MKTSWPKENLKIRALILGAFLHVSNWAVNNNVCYLTNNHEITNLTFMKIIGNLNQYDKCKYDMWKRICLCICNK